MDGRSVGGIDLDIIRMLEDLNAVAVEKVKSVGPISWGLNRDEVSMKITMIMSSLPKELKDAVQTVRDSEKILSLARQDADATVENGRRESERVVTESRKEAEKVIEHAKLQQDRMVSESEVLKLARAQAEEIRNSAERDAVQMRRDAEGYAYNVLRQLESVVGKVMTAVERGKAEMDKSDAPALSGSTREKVRA